MSYNSKYTGEQVEEFLDFNLGSVEVSSLSSLPITKRLLIANISQNNSLSLSSIPTSGKEIHIIIKNTTSSDLVVTLPNSDNYVCFVDTALTVTANGYAEVNVISDGTKMYIRGV